MKKRSRIKNSLRNAMAGFLSQMLIILLGFVTRTVFISVLGKVYLGIDGLFTNILTVLSLSELGVDTAINFRLYQPLAERDDHRVRVLIKFYKQAYRVIGIAIAGIGGLLILFLPYLIKDYSTLNALKINAAFVFSMYLLQSVSSYLFFAYRSAVIKADQRTYILDISGMIITVLTNVVQIAMLLLFKSFILYTITITLTNIIRNGINAIIAKKMYPDFFIKEKDSLSKTEILELFKDCGALFLYKVNNVVVKSTDNIVLSSFIGLSIVGMYSNYLLFYSAIRSFLGKFYDALKSSMGNLYVTSDTEKSLFFFEVMNFLSIILYGTAAVGIVVLADELIELWIGADYLIQQPFSLLMGIEVLFVGIKMNLGQMRNVSGAFRQMWFRPVLGVLINLVASIVLVQYIGIYGILIGTISADFFANFLVDPQIIYKYSFNNIKSVSSYYTTTLRYIFVLGIICIIDYYMCSFVIFSNATLTFIIHLLFCAFSVPIIYIVLYRKSPVCMYLISTAKRILHRNF